MRKSLIALAAVTMIAAPTFTVAANAAPKAKPEATKIFIKKQNEKFALELGKDGLDTKAKKKPFIYNGPKNAFSINGIF